MLQKIMQSGFNVENINFKTLQHQGYIQNILLLVGLMQIKKLSPAEGQLFFVLRHTYQEEYLGLLKVHNPISYQVYLEEQQVLFNLQQA